VLEGKIKLTNPSDEIADSYLIKSNKSLISSKTLLKIKNYEDATALIYYSMYYSTLALLFKAGIKSENHVGTIILLMDSFGIDNKEISKAKKERVDKQYYVEFSATTEEVQEGIEIAEKFNARIREQIEKLTNLELDKIRKQLKKDYF